jgi:hypothetical protein
MEPRDIQSLCIAGTDAYLNFLVQNNRGLDRIHVSHKESLDQFAKPAFKLVLAARLFDPDSIALELTPPGQTFGPKDFRVVEYDSDAKVLIIEIVNPALAMDTTPANNVWVISDLRFLVKNVRQWYASNGLQLRLPEMTSGAPRCAPAAQEQLTPVQLESCQKEAVERSLENPLTYVWGPPGTGKTKHVLTQAALQLLLSQKKVGIFAPTNNALEQAMEAVIKAAEGTGISREKFLRVGYPSNKFANSFPEVCEVQGLQKRISEIERQIENYKKVLEYRRGATVLNSVATLTHEIGTLQSLLGERSGIYQALSKMRANLLSRAIHLLDGKVQALNDRLAKLEMKINGQLEMIRRTNTESSRLNAILNRIDFTNVETTEQEISDLQNATRQYMEVSRTLADEYQGQPNEELQRLLTDLERQLVALKAETVLERMKTASVIGMTLDCFIGRFHDTLLPFDHIFLDEAGYAPLAKALTLCRGDIPLTFFGDHMQLGPVCEMDDGNLNTPANRRAILWIKSSLFVDETFLAPDAGTLLTNLFRSNEPKLNSFARVNLDKTFRFGQNLADLLSRHVYHGLQLVSAEDHQDLEIVCLNAVPAGPPAMTRQSYAEVAAITAYLAQQVQLLNTDSEEAYAILTPYNHQVTLLGASLSQARRQGRIMTVHKSQGREWDTVIISIVDGRFNRPWFTDTPNMQTNGIHVMNTAISRARKRLVIVCDANYWARSSNQLVSLLLNLTN